MDGANQSDGVIAASFLSRVSQLILTVRDYGGPVTMADGLNEPKK